MKLRNELNIELTLIRVYGVRRGILTTNRKSLTTRCTSAPTVVLLNKATGGQSKVKPIGKFKNEGSVFTNDVAWQIILRIHDKEIRRRLVSPLKARVQIDVICK